VIQEQVRAPERYWDVTQANPERDLHDEKSGERHDIGAGLLWKLLARIDQHLIELGQLLPDKKDRSKYLDCQQEKVGCRFWVFVIGLHRANDISSTGPEPIDLMVLVCLGSNGVSSFVHASAAFVHASAAAQLCGPISGWARSAHRI
jgi:hypothetical protein